MINDTPANRKVAKIFAKINMSDLPAMSEVVRELLSLAGSNQATAQKLADIILKDYSLTSKILQLANSAYYSRGVPINTIDRAVSAIGLNTVKDLATAIALFEDFVKTGVEKESLSILLAQSFLSATFAKYLCRQKKLQISEEEAFLCSLFYNLGKIIVLIYLPDLYRKIEESRENNKNDSGLKEEIEELTFLEIGRKVGRFWNFSDQIVMSMVEEPAAPESVSDTNAFLHNIAVFSNRLTIHFFNRLDISELLKQYGALFSVGKTETLRLFAKCVNASWDVSESIRFGLTKLQTQLSETT